MMQANEEHLKSHEPPESATLNNGSKIRSSLQKFAKNLNI